MENMTRVPFLLPEHAPGHRLGNTEAVDAMYRDGLLDPLCGLIMGETAENLVDMYGISRAEQDEFALRSQRKAVEGAERRAAEIVPGRGHDGHARPSTVTDDEHVRPDTTLESLGKPRPVFREGGSVTAGNSSGHHRRRRGHGADERVARQGRRARAARRDHRDVVGRRAPEIMGIGPVPATQKVMDRLGLHDRRLRAIEINEAFAAQVIACERELKFERDRAQRQRRRHLGRATRSA